MVDDDESPSRLSRSLSARFRRKEQVARGEQVAETREEEEAALTVADQPVAAESDEDAALDDDQLLEKYGLSNPDEIEDEAGLDAFMESGLPDRLRQMALRRMWRLNPLFRFADEMVEYGENYTDAATVIDGMTTAYQVGKGYLQKTLDAVEKAGEADTGTTSGIASGTTSGTEADAKAKADADADAETETDAMGEAEPHGKDENGIGDGTEDGTEDGAEDGAEDGGGQTDEDGSVTTLQAHEGVHDNKAADHAGDTSATLQETVEKTRPRPQRMAFRRPAI